MNLPNKLTMLRIFLIPVMVALFFIENMWAVYASTAVFVLASFTDFLDGHIARKHGLVTDFGKFLDPIADKLLVVTALILIMATDVIPIPYFASISLIIVIAREFAISGLRLIATTKNMVIAADKLGKAKTVTQVVAIPFLMVAHALTFTQSATHEIFLIFVLTGTALYGLSTLICIISGVNYLVKNKEVFLSTK